MKFCNAVNGHFAAPSDASVAFALFTPRATVILQSIDLALSTFVIGAPSSTQSMLGEVLTSHELTNAIHTMIFGQGTTLVCFEPLT